MEWSGCGSVFIIYYKWGELMKGKWVCLRVFGSVTKCRFTSVIAMVFCGEVGFGQGARKV